MTDLKYLGSTVTGRNCIQEMMKSGLNSRSAWCHADHSPLFLLVLSKNVWINVYRTAIVHFDLCVRETLSLVLKDGQEFVFRTGC